VACGASIQPGLLGDDGSGVTLRRAHGLTAAGAALAAALGVGLVVPGDPPPATLAGTTAASGPPPSRTVAAPKPPRPAGPTAAPSRPTAGPSRATAGPVERPMSVRTSPSPVRRTVRIMPLGDSITRGVGSARINSYRLDLDRRLRAAGVDVDLVGSQRDGDGRDPDHEGHSGWTIIKIADRVPEWLATYRPDVILLHIGTNDLSSDAAAAEAPGKLDRLLRRIQETSPGTEVFVAALVGAKTPDRQRRIDAYNAAVRQLAARLGTHVHLVDQSSVGGLDIRDELHPNDFGYAKMSFNFYTALGRVLAGPGRAWPVGANPYLAREMYRCLQPPGGGAVQCHWYRDGVVVEGAVAGGPFYR
jgi:lysophospholipase L1-like esterase